MITNIMMELAKIMYIVDWWLLQNLYDYEMIKISKHILELITRL